MAVMVVSEGRGCGDVVGALVGWLGEPISALAFCSIHGFSPQASPAFPLLGANTCALTAEVETESENPDPGTIS